MQITVSLSRLLDDMYADSAIAAILGRRNPDNTVPLLTPGHCHALKRVAMNAAASVALTLAPRLKDFSMPEFVRPSDANPSSDDITFTVDDSTRASPEALKIHFANAITFECLRFIAISAGDLRKADAYAQCVSDSADTIANCLDNLSAVPSLRPSYY